MKRNSPVSKHWRLVLLSCAFLDFLSSSNVRLSAYLKKLIQVGGHDAQVAQPLQQWHVRTNRPIKHTLVKGQDAVVAVQKHVGRPTGYYRVVGHVKVVWRRRGNVVNPSVGGFTL